MKIVLTQRFGTVVYLMCVGTRICCCTTLERRGCWAVTEQLTELWQASRAADISSSTTVDA